MDYGGRLPRYRDSSSSGSSPGQYRAAGYASDRNRRHRAPIDRARGNDGSYGTCNKNCTLAPYCGDGIVNGPELCDNGANNSDTAYGPGSCTKSCTLGPYCGDGRIQTANGEQCDPPSNVCSSTCMTIVIP